MRLRDGVPYEAVFTIKAGKLPLVVPLGFVKRGNKVFVRVYKSASFIDQITSSRLVVANAVRDPTMFYYAAFEREKRFQGDVFEYEGNGLPVLKIAEGYIVLELVSLRDRGEVVELEYEVKEIADKGGEVEPYTRCDALAIEAIIYATKIKALANTNSPDFERALAGYRYSASTLRRICSENYLGLLDRIEERVRTYEESRG